MASPYEKDDDKDSTGASAFQAHMAKLSAQKQPLNQKVDHNLNCQTIMTPFGDTVVPATNPLSTTAIHNNGGINNGGNSLQHMQYNWPRNENAKHRLDVRPLLYYDLLSCKYPIVIPLFQRRYCWTMAQIQQWYHDVANPVAGQHSTHKTMFKKQKLDSIEVLLCMDGQQRMTTATLFLAALRVQCRKEKLFKLVDKIDAIMFKGSESKRAIANWAQEQAQKLIQQNSNQDNDDWTFPEFPSGWLPKTFLTTIIPSYVDRVAYFEIIFTDHLEEALETLQATNTSLGASSSCRSSIQYTAYSYFVQQLSYAVDNAASNKVPSFLSRLFQKQLQGFTVMYTELLTDDNLQQVFLWMQEKYIFGMGSLLHNPHPGVGFFSIDLARNLVVSSVMNETLDQQAQFYQQCWLIPFEERFGKDGEKPLEDILNRLVQRVDRESGDGRHVGDMEQQLEQYKILAPPALQKQFEMDTPMMMYARFHSHVQKKALDMEGNSHAITRAVADSIVQELVQEGEQMEM